MTTTYYTCRCGELDGSEHCDWAGSLDELVLCEYMPQHLRASHAAARNSGTYPANGAIRAAIHIDCASVIEEGCEWFRRLGDPENLADYAERATVTITPQGGTTFSVRCGNEFLGRTEFGSIDEDGQYIEDDDEIIEHVRETFCLDDASPVIVQL
jgi:hypothetical protein